MASANFSRDVLDMFYGQSEENQRIRWPMRPRRRIHFVLNRNNFNNWLRVWKMDVRMGNRDLFQFIQRNKDEFIDICRQEVEDLKSVKIQFALHVRFYINRNDQVDYMDHYFNRMQPIILNEDNIGRLNDFLNHFVDEVRGDIEAWSQRGSGWAVDEILEAVINVARYQPLRGGTYMPLPEKLKNKKAIINIKNRDNMCLRWALRAHLFPARTHVDRPSSYPTNDGLDFTGIDFPTPVSQIGKIERQNPGTAINVFGWDKDEVIVYRLSEQDGNNPRINLMLTKKEENTHYSLIKRLTALLYDQTKHNESKHFCERCLHGFFKKDLLERHKPECKGLLKSPTRTELPKEGENKMSFKNHHKQMKSPYVVYADFEYILRKMHGCEPSPEASFTVKTEKHEPCGFAYTIVRSDGATYGPFNCRGEDAVFVFLSWLKEHERQMRAEMENKRPLVMTPEDWQKHRNATDCHMCNKSLIKATFLDSVSVHNPYTGIYCGQGHRICLLPEMRKFTGQPHEKIKPVIKPKQDKCGRCQNTSFG